MPVESLVMEIILVLKPRVKGLATLQNDAETNAWDENKA